MTAYAATNYDVDYFGFAIRIPIGQILYAGDTITQKELAYTGGFKIVYQDAEGERKSRFANGNDSLPMRCIEIDSAASGYSAWQVFSDNEEETFDISKVHLIVLQPYGKITDEPNTEEKESKVQEPVYIDRDTYKSELPAGTIMSIALLTGSK